MDDSCDIAPGVEAGLYSTEHRGGYIEAFGIARDDESSMVCRQTLLIGPAAWVFEEDDVAVRGVAVDATPRSIPVENLMGPTGAEIVVHEKEVESGMMEAPPYISGAGTVGAGIAASRDKLPWAIGVRADGIRDGTH